MSVSQAEGPEPQVRGRVRDAAQTILDGVNGLMHEHVRCIKLQTDKGRWKDEEDIIKMTNPRKCSEDLE